MQIGLLTLASCEYLGASDLEWFGDAPAIVVDG